MSKNKHYKEEFLDFNEEVETVKDDFDLLDNDIDGKLKDWLTTNDISLSEIQCTLYKYENADSGTDKAQIGIWKNDIPDRHSIGLTHGAGKYTLLIIKPKSSTGDRKITSRTFKLHEHYNTLMAEEKAKKQPHIVDNRPYYPPPQENNSLDTFKMVSSMMQNMMSMITPIIQAAIAPKQIETPQQQNPLSQYGMIEKLLQNNAKNNIEFYGELQKKMIDKDIEANSEHEPTILQQLLPMIDKFLPMFTQKKPSVEAENLLQSIKGSNEYKEITSNKETVNTLINHLEQKHGKTKLNTVLKNLNIKRPKM